MTAPGPREPSHRTQVAVLVVVALAVGGLLIATRCVPDVADASRPGAPVPTQGTPR